MLFSHLCKWRNRRAVPELLQTFDELSNLVFLVVHDGLFFFQGILSCSIWSTTAHWYSLSSVLNSSSLFERRWTAKRSLWDIFCFAFKHKTQCSKQVIEVWTTLLRLLAVVSSKTLNSLWHDSKSYKRLVCTKPKIQLFTGQLTVQCIWLTHLTIWFEGPKCLCLDWV